MGEADVAGGGPAEEGAEPFRIPVDVERGLDQAAGRRGEADAKFGVGKQAGEGVGESGGVAPGDLQPRLAVAEHLGDARHVRGDARRAERNRFEEHRRQAVAVAVAADHARGGEDGGPAEPLDHLALRARAAEAHVRAEVEPLDPGPEGGFEVASTDDPARKGGPPISQVRAGLNEIGEPLFLNQTPHGKNFRWPLTGGGKGETVEVEPVIDTRHTSGIGPVPFP